MAKQLWGRWAFTLAILVFPLTGCLFKSEEKPASAPAPKGKPAIVKENAPSPEDLKETDKGLPAMQKIFRGNLQRTGVYETQGVHQNPSIKWKFQVGTRFASEFSCPVIANGVVYYAGRASTLYALDFQTGQEQWTLQLDSDVTAPHALSDQTLYFGCGRGELHAVDIQKREARWVFPTGERVSSSPAITHQAVFFGNLVGTLFSVNVQTGKENWHFKTGAPIESSPALVDGTLFFGSQDGFFYALDAKTGQEKWKFFTVTSMPELPNKADCTPNVVNGVVYFFGVDGMLYALDAQSGKLLWSLKNEGTVFSHDGAVVTDGMILYGGMAGSFSSFNFEEGYFKAVDLKTREPRWQIKTKGMVGTAPTVADGVVYFGTFSGELWALDVKTSQEKWRLPIPGGEIASTPVIADGVIFVGGKEGYLYAIH